MISEIELKNFRNYTNENIKFSDTYNIFLGSNGQGKTNVLEAIHILATTKSFRYGSFEDFLKNGESVFKIGIKIHKNNVYKSISSHFEDKHKIFRLNDKKIKKISDVLGAINVSILCPEDIMIIKGDSSYRRRFMDICLCQLDKIYLFDLIRYNKLVKNKNALLKLIKLNKASKEEINAWNDKIIESSISIYEKRLNFIKHIEEKSSEITLFLSEKKENVRVKYIDSIFSGEEMAIEDYGKEFKNKQKRVFDEEIRRGSALFGPHRDDLRIEINGQNIRNSGSQGQQRTMAIGLRLAEVEYMRSTSGHYPILLIDDIFSELDDSRKAYFIDLLNRDTQVFLTGTREEEFSKILDKGYIFHVSEGRVERHGK